MTQITPTLHFQLHKRTLHHLRQSYPHTGVRHSLRVLLANAWYALASGDSIQPGVQLTREDRQRLLAFLTQPGRPHTADTSALIARLMDLELEENVQEELASPRTGTEEEEYLEECFFRRYYDASRGEQGVWANRARQLLADELGLTLPQSTEENEIPPEED